MTRISLLVLLSVLLNACSDDPGGRAFGTLERDRITLTAPASEVITAMPVHEGQTVVQGELLLTLDDTRADATLRAQQASLQQAEARLQELQTGARGEELASAAARVDGARATLLEAERQLQRSRALRTDNLIGQAEVDAALARRDSAAASLRQAQEQWRELHNGTRPEQLAQAEAAVAVARAQVDSARKALTELTLTAPTDAVVDTLPWHQGDRINAGTVAITLLTTTAPYARVYLPANRIDRPKEGGAVKVRIDGLTQIVDGIISHIRAQPAFTPYYALSERDRAALMYLAEIHFSDEVLKTIANIPTGRTLEVILP